MRVSCDSFGINSALKALKNGGTVVFPTDTVYGIGCNPYNKKAVEKIYEIKKRPTSKFFPILGYSKDELSKIAVFDAKSNKIAERFWPGPITLVLKLKDTKLKQSLNTNEKIAVRVPKNSCILSILKKCKLIIGTSANKSGEKSFTNPNDCIEQISGYDVFVDGGIIPTIGESTIVDVDDDLRMIREGIISEKEIRGLF